MHAIQTSGNSFRNTTADPFAGAAADEIEDPRPYCEIIRQWSTLHPEFSFLPRKFKIAVSGAPSDRAAVRDARYRPLYAPQRGGRGRLRGAGRRRARAHAAPRARPCARSCPKRHLLSYLEAILRVYNQFGRRDNLYKSRIKILVQSLGIDPHAREVEAEWAAMDHEALALPDDAIADMARHFAPPDPTAGARRRRRHARGARGRARLRPLGRAATSRRTRCRAMPSSHISLKAAGRHAGRCTAEQMELVADLADAFSQGEIRVTHEQNLVLPHVRRVDLPALWRALASGAVSPPRNIGLASDIIACPGLDYCSLATARSIPVAQRLALALAPREREIGDLQIKISGCINACGHHHVGHIGLLGVDKNGEEFYQITLGGSADENAAVGAIIGPAVPSDEIVHAVDKLVDVYLACARTASASPRPIAASAPSPSRRRSMPLIKGGRFVADPWRALSDDEPMPEAPRLIVSYARWLKRARRARAASGATRPAPAERCLSRRSSATISTASR